MGSSASKNEETNEIKAVQEMDEEELSSKDKLFKKAIVEIYEELKKVKDQKERQIYLHCSESGFMQLEFILIK